METHRVCSLHSIAAGKEKELAPSSILREAKIAYYARNMFEAGRFFFS